MVTEDQVSISLVERDKFRTNYKTALHLAASSDNLRARVRARVKQLPQILGPQNPGTGMQCSNKSRVGLGLLGLG